ncbi:DUF7344 domain-containing protein [Halorussus halophilus]|uniref:DUF7344 domain-containing protein n=1 Tax=Halorussus halophilus TaxID=2650975 RepID=UPI00130110C1|nr:hypothetical protein [Halorussus halophilus]
MDRTQATDALYDCLSHRHRRWTLAVLDQRERAVTVRELAEEIAAHERDESGDPANKIRTSLYHVHLPKLTEIGLARYDEGARMVWLTDDADDVVSDLPQTDECPVV